MVSKPVRENGGSHLKTSSEIFKEEMAFIVQSTCVLGRTGPNHTGTRRPWAGGEQGHQVPRRLQAFDATRQARTSWALSSFWQQRVP